MNCNEFVELVTAYLDGALPDRESAEVDEHLTECPGCRTVLSQWRTVAELAGRLTEDDVTQTDPLTQDRLMSAFRRARRR